MVTPVSPKKRTAPKGKVLARKKKKEAPAISAEETVIIQFVSADGWYMKVSGAKDEDLRDDIKDTDYSFVLNDNTIPQHVSEYDL
ncbi:hypothetical protein Pmar_PMAR020255 [Perkinsus marinus ATCC 50983]|uniref:Uncharacterized protein n=1 Tax=Perkinsus marinus (strain ATCC 50983 / TXsc) TaxID=423536 RepID=C5LTZ9_PERM5|nr:hypothetical protein Pmar_PMAR020255 [Perkinsus marinus ATCC 50983]EEQ99797.1 hypothetical protein Pmar_PMAR020255 [Perkinsus marinus ATCC 50983]|eukprot:XP_002767080.1 hypothetical protein Pmar_PMAR020255 [Perkinsus marinus ATCC 50983]